MRFQLVCLLVFSMISFSYAEPAISECRINTLAAAEKISLIAFKKYTQRKIKNIKFRLIEENSSEFVFSFENIDVIPRPGSDYYVVVKKSTGEVEISMGK